MWFYTIIGKFPNDQKWIAYAQAFWGILLRNTYLLRRQAFMGMYTVLDWRIVVLVAVRSVFSDHAIVEEKYTHFEDFFLF